MPPFRLRRVAGALLAALVAAAAPDAARAQEAYQLRGTVVDATGRQPLAGVNVTLRGTGARTATDAQGRYTLAARVPAGPYVLEFSSLGRAPQTQPVALGAARVVDVPAVALRETAVELQALVVTGTGAPVERRQVGNTVATVSGEAVRESPGATAIDQALQGKIPGAVITENSGQPGGGVSIRLRGTSTIYGSAEPLIVIDGVLVDNNSEALVGLGANATRGNAALTNRLADIPPGDIERVEVLKGAAAAALYGSRANSGVIQIFTRRGRQGRPQVTFRTELQANRTGERLRLNLVPLGNRADSVASGGAIRTGTPVERFDIQDQLFRTGYGTSNQLSVAGGTEGTTYYLSGNWETEDGILRSTDFERAAARARVSQRLSEALEVGLNLGYLRSTTNYVPEGEQTQGLLTQVVFTPTYFDPARDEATGRYPYTPVLGPNPFDIIENWEARSDVQRLLGSVQGSWTPARGLSLTYLAGLDDSREENRYFQPPQALSAAFTGSIQNPIRQIRKFNQDLTANYEAPLGPSLGSATTVGMRYTSDRVNTVRAAASELPPGGTEVVTGAVQTASQSITELRTLGAFVQQRLAWRDRVILTAGVNTEASSAFGADQRWQTFPRLGLSWIASDEPGFATSFAGRALSTLRLRAAYGETGGQPPSEYLNQVTYLNVSYAGRPGLRPNTLAPNPELKPERQREWEVGFEAGALADRLSIEATYYDKETSDLLLLVPLATSSGFASQWQNVGRLSNRGVELAISSVNVDRDGFRWTSRLQYARNRNRVERLNASSDTIVFDYLNAVIEGQPIGVFLGGFYPRDAQGRIILAGPRNAAGFPIAGAPRVPSRARGFNPLRGDSSIILRRVLGDPNPDFTASLSNEFRLGRLEVNVLLDGQFGNDVANFTRRTSDFFGSSANAGLESAGDTVPGTFTRNTDRNLLYEEFIEDGTFVKLREVGVAVAFDDPWVRRLGGAERMVLRVAARNLFTWTDYSGLDPEVNLFSASTVSRGVDFATTPIPRTLSVGLTFDF